MWALFKVVVNLSLFFFSAAFAIGVLGGLTSIVWRWSTALRALAHGTVKLGGELLMDAVHEFARRKLPVVAGPNFGASRSEMEKRITSLEAALSAALSRATAQARLLKELRDEAKGQKKSEHTLLFAQVGLHPNSEEFLVRAARSAYRKQYHPDVCKVAEAPEATRRFQSSEAAFERIFAARDWNG